MTTLTVEDGTGVASANSYASLGHARGYHAGRGTAEAWIEDVSVAGASMLVEATRAIERSFGWKGTIFTTTQGLGLPRTTIYLEDGRTLDAAAQVALAADAASHLALRLYQWRVAGDLGGERRVQSERLLDYSVTYEGGDQRPDWPEVDEILAPIARSGGLGGGTRQVRTARWS